MSDCLCTLCGNCKHDHGGYRHQWTNTPQPPKALVTLFKPSGKYYTEEEWVIPTEAELEELQKTVDRPMRDYHFVPTCMRWSKDFRRISGTGAVLVQTQEPWGFPHLFPGLNSG